MKYPIWLSMCSAAGLALMLSCGGSTATSSSAEDAPDVTTTVTMNLSFTDAAASVSAKGANVEKAAVAGSIACRSVDAAGTVTRTNATISENAAAVADMPKEASTVCHQLNSSGTVIGTLHVADSNALSAGRDTFQLAADTTATVAHNSATNVSSVTCADCAAPTIASDLADPSGTWTVQCTDVRAIIDDAVSTTESCPTLFGTGISVELHRIQGTDPDSNTRFAVSPWGPSAFATCGSTEGLDNLPTGWAVTTPGQTAAFSWSAPFTSFSSSSTDAEIQTMIQNVTASTTTGVSTTYAEFKAGGSCGSNPIESHCIANYWWIIIAAAGQQNGASTCWPEFAITYSQTGATFASRTSPGGTATPMGRYDFMEAWVIGTSLYMSSTYSEVLEAYDSLNDSLGTCLLTEDLLIETDISGGTPATGAVLTSKFINDRNATGVSGLTDARCEVLFSTQDSDFAPRGYYLNNTLTKQ